MTVFLGFLPLLAWLCFLGMVGRDRPREAVLLASVAWGVVVVVVTEVLSALGLLTSAGLGLAWAAIALLAAPAWRRMRSRPPEWPRPSRSVLAYGAAVGWMVAGTGVIAVIAAPNTWDSMTYHLARVAHWAQDHSVGPYPTHILRQLHQPPWAEFAILQFQVLTGGDHWANLVQWFAMLGSLVGVSLLAEELGADRRGQWLAAVFAATLPMGILQASSTQNDYVVSFWLVVLAVFAVRAMRRRRFGPVDIGAAGAALGLALLTKGTGYIFAAPLGILLVLGLYRLDGMRAYRPVGAVLVVAALLNAGFWSRNVAVYGSPLGPGHEGGAGEYGYAMESFGPGAWASNVVRDLALHLGTPVDRVNAVSTSVVRALHRPLGLSPDDPRTTWTDQRFEVPRMSKLEDTAGNPLHLVLIVVAVTVAAIRWRDPELRPVRSLAMTLLLGFLLFALLVKWQPWGSRLQLPLFVLWAAPVGWLSGRFSRGLGRFAAVVLLLAAVPWVLDNTSRPLFGPKSILRTPRTEQYFFQRPELLSPYRQAAAAVRAERCDTVGLWMGLDEWEYPLWVLLDGPPRPRIEHVHVTNVSASTAPEERPDPCVALGIWTDSTRVTPEVPPDLTVQRDLGAVLVLRETGS